jgi:HK97 family phage portal protein
VRSLIGGAVATIRNAAPVPYVSRSGSGSGLALLRRDSPEAQMRAMGAVGTLFAIVDRTSTAAAAVDWRLWRKAKSGKPEDRVEVVSHLALDIWGKPNDFTTRQELVESGQQHLDLTGEGWLVVARNPAVRSIPLELWPVRPDRMSPVPSRENFLAGYVYSGPDGEQVPLRLDEVIFIRRPNPLDPYRGMGPVQSILTDLDAEKYTAEWNRNFFLNSAEPGGIIEVEKRLSDDEFDELTTRWQEQHRGVARAHRVAVLEQGKWVDRKFTQRDMQFAELRRVSKETIREAFGMPKFAVGDVADINRATAEASKAWFAEQITVPRLERWKQALNNDFLPLFGPTATGLEFDYESPVESDREADNAERVSKADAAQKYIQAGYDGESVKLGLDLPDALVWVGQPAPVPQVEPAQAPALAPAAMLTLAPARRLRNAADLDPGDLPDVTPLQGQWERALARLLADWDRISVAQKAALVDRVEEIAAGGTLTDLTALTVDSGDAADTLEAAMVALAAAGAQRVVAEADEQGVVVAAQPPTDLGDVATVVAASLAGGLVLSAIGAAMRANGPGVSARQIAAAVREHLAALTDAQPALQLGGALTGAQNAGRIATLRAAPEGALYASEVNDANTCGPCSEVDGRWLGNISDMGQVERSYPGGAYGAYVECKGGVRCRGTVVGIWRE